jgi:CheY-like chemotaxis protein
MAVALKNLAGKRVLIVEDEMLIAVLIETFLSDFGCSTLGPYSAVADALKAVATEPFDLAVLDVNLNGEKSYPIAHALAARRIPFVFVSGYGDGAIPAGHDHWRVCPKPFTSDDLATMLSTALGAVASAGPGSG